MGIALSRPIAFHQWTQQYWQPLHRQYWLEYWSSTCTYLALHVFSNMVKNGKFTVFLFFYAVGLPAERFARLDVWHYHLDASENLGEVEDTGLSLI